MVDVQDYGGVGESRELCALRCNVLVSVIGWMRSARGDERRLRPVDDPISSWDARCDVSQESSVSPTYQDVVPGCSGPTFGLSYI